MSVDATIKIYFATRKEKFISKTNLIKVLYEHGWSFNDNGKISYLPIGDNELFQWRNEEISIESLLSLLREKEIKGEMIGVVMTWENTEIGGEFLFTVNGEMLISLSLNRKRIADDMVMNITDVNWYLVRIIPVFNKANLLIEAYSYSENT